MDTGRGVKDYVEAEQNCKYCDGTGITQRQTAADDFEEERCECQGDDDFVEPPVFYFGENGIVYV